MSYSALTELGVDPVCPACKKEIVHGEKIALVLVTEAVISRGYNAENELDERSVTADMDWQEQVTFHLDCVKRVARGMLPDHGHEIFD